MSSCLDLDIDEDSYPSGWLWKVGSQVPTWRRRYFKLESGCLVYYKDKPDVNNTHENKNNTSHVNGIKPIGTVIIDASCRIEKLNSYATRLKSSRKDCIRLLGGHGRCIILAADVVTAKSTFSTSSIVADQTTSSNYINTWFDALSVEIGRLEIEALMIVEQTKLAKRKANNFQFSTIPFPKNHFNFNEEGESVMITGVAWSARPSRCFSAPVNGTIKDSSQSKNNLSLLENKGEVKQKSETMALVIAGHIGNNGGSGGGDDEISVDDQIIEAESTLRAVLRNIPHIQECDGGYIPRFDDLHYFFSPPDSCIPEPSMCNSSHGSSSYAPLSVSERYSQFIFNTSMSISESYRQSNFMQSNPLVIASNPTNGGPPLTTSPLKRPASFRPQLSSSSLLGSAILAPPPPSPKSTAMARSSSHNLVLSQYQRRSSTLSSMANNQWQGFSFDWEENPEVLESTLESDSDDD